MKPLLFGGWGAGQGRGKESEPFRAAHDHIFPLLPTPASAEVTQAGYIETSIRANVKYSPAAMMFPVSSDWESKWRMVFDTNRLM